MSDGYEDMGRAEDVFAILEPTVAADLCKHRHR